MCDIPIDCTTAFEFDVPAFPTTMLPEGQRMVAPASIPAPPPQTTEPVRERIVVVYDGQSHRSSALQLHHVLYGTSTPFPNGMPSFPLHMTRKNVDALECSGFHNTFDVSTSNTIVSPTSAMLDCTFTVCYRNRTRECNLVDYPRVRAHKPTYDYFVFADIFDSHDQQEHL